jgi:GntR family transcriptional regulator/MocR family aminotransferase
MPGATITGLDAGHHVLLRLPAGVDEQRVAASARAAGIAVRGVGDYRVTPDDAGPGSPVPAALVIGFGNATTRQIRDGIRILGELVAASMRPSFVPDNGTERSRQRAAEPTPGHKRAGQACD